MNTEPFSSARVQCKWLSNAGVADSAWDFRAPGRTISPMPGWGRSGADSAGELLLERTKTLQARSNPDLCTHERYCQIVITAKKTPSLCPEDSAR